MKSLLEMLDFQERQLRFSGFDHSMAWRVGETIVRKVSDRQKAVALEIRMGGRTVFSYVMPGATPGMADWARRKCNTVELALRSSYAVGCSLPIDGEDWRTRLALPARDYATKGGGFPIFVNSVGCIGALAVSGLPQRDDHEVVVESLCELTAISFSDLRLPIEA